jgi:hypothetical protein
MRATIKEIEKMLKDKSLPQKMRNDLERKKVILQNDKIVEK